MMKTIIAKAVAIIAVLAVGIASVGTPVMAAGPAEVFGVPTNILKDCGAKEGKESIMCILELAVDILSIGVGILGVIGISIAGIQYLTAGGNEEKTRKAKRRLFEIVIGLAAYAVVYAFLNWLLPNFSS